MLLNLFCSQVGDQITTTIKNVDRWEFPRHRLKFFNIIGEGAFGQVWKCEAYDIDGKFYVNTKTKAF